jgi:hypothetical protein
MRAWEEHSRGRGRQPEAHEGRQGRRQRPEQPRTLMKKWTLLAWEKAWKKAARSQAARGQEATTWHNPWTTRTTNLYEGLPKYLATALLLLRTEVLGLNAWLARVRVPGISPHCPCGWHEQTVRHIFFNCPRHSQARQALIRETRSDDLRVILSRPSSARAAARWFVKTGLLQQFQAAAEIDNEDLSLYEPLPGLHTW